MSLLIFDGTMGLTVLTRTRVLARAVRWYREDRDRAHWNIGWLEWSMIGLCRQAPERSHQDAYAVLLIQSDRGNDEYKEQGGGGRQNLGLGTMVDKVQWRDLQC